MEKLPKVALPFTRTSNLPAPLPTIEQIHASSEIVQGKEKWSTRRVVLVGEFFLVKYGRRLYQVEGENLLFVEKHLRIRAPLLYAMWRESNGELYIIMEWIPGQPLEHLWQTLNADDRGIITGKLRNMFDQMRSLPSPGFYGSVTAEKLPHALFWSPEKDPRVEGPFKNGRDLICGLARKSRQNWALNDRHSYKADFFENHMSPALSDNVSTFSHSDLIRKNIIVRKIELEGSDLNDYDVALIDWEDAGWYPAYWEYAVAFASFIWFDDDWSTTIPSILDVWCAESAMLKLAIEDILM